MPSINQWTPALRRRFIECLSTSGNVRGAAGACGLSRQSAYKLRGRDLAFAREWDAALAGLRAAFDAELMRGMAENPRLAPVWQAMKAWQGR